MDGVKCPGLESQVLVGCLTWVLGTELLAAKPKASLQSLLFFLFFNGFLIGLGLSD